MISTPAKIDDYGFLSDCHSAALVDREGSVDWWCVPRFDSPSVSAGCSGRTRDGGDEHRAAPADGVRIDDPARAGAH